MLTVNIGPFPLPVRQLVLMLALLAALGVGGWVARRQSVAGAAEKPGIRLGATLSDMLLAALLVARLVFVAIWFDSYREASWSMLDVRDGGFTPWAGVLAALLVALWRGWRHTALRQPLAWGLLAGALAWGAMLGALRLLEPADSALPAVRLTTLAGEPVDLASLAAGKPLVVNLWASWCPPCRREMPVLAAAQQRESGLSFVFANQGEDGATVLRYLASQAPGLSQVVFDPTAALGRAVGSRALPTTLFYDASGRLVDSHLGELSAASLASKLRQLHTPALDLP